MPGLAAPHLVHAPRSQAQKAVNQPVHIRPGFSISWRDKHERQRWSCGSNAAPPPNGAVKTPNGAVKTPNSAVKIPIAAVETSNDAVETPNGAVETPTGAVETLNGAVETLNGAVEILNGAVETLNSAVETLNSAVEIHERGHTRRKIAAVLVPLRGTVLSSAAAGS